jgi:hypothetical protein
MHLLPLEKTYIYVNIYIYIYIFLKERRAYGIFKPKSHNYFRMKDFVMPEDIWIENMIQVGISEIRL